MLREIWLHIGTAKSGTTALQHYLNDNRDLLLASGLDYITAPGHSSANKLAIAINKRRQDELQQISDHISERLSNSPARTALISSEMFFGMAPELILGAVPALAEAPLSVLVYIRRQDRYIESKYIQKMKNGRFKGSIWDYIEKFQGSGSDYAAELRPWTNVECLVRPRICESDKLVGGSTVTDALSVMGFDDLAAQVPAQRVENTSPSLGRIQLMQALSQAGHPRVRQIQRALPADTQGKARILSSSQKRAYFDSYADSNELLRRSYFAGQSDLFDTSDLDGPDRELSDGYSDAQLQEITRIFELLIPAQGK